MMPAPHTMADDFLSAALGYARRGWAVFPCWWPTTDGCNCSRGLACERPGKHPLGRVVPNGLLDATSDENRIKTWWSQYPRANVAIRTGPESGVFVLDVDAYKGGAVSLDELEFVHGRLPTSIRARTGSGGASLHVLFAYPKGVRVASRPIPQRPGLDIKGDGGYVIVAPSLHRSGNTYFWLDEDDSFLEPAPDWLLGIVTSAQPQAPKAPLPTGLELDEDNAAAVCQKLIERAAKKIYSGEARHDASLWFFVQCKDNAVPFDVAVEWIDALHTIANEMGGRRVEPSELRRSLEWAYSKGRRDPFPSTAKMILSPPEMPWEPPDEVPGWASEDPGFPADSGSRVRPPKAKEPASSVEGTTWLSLAEVIARAKDVSQRFTTGIPTLDRITAGGIPRGRVLMIVGKPGSGKTTLAIQLALDMADQGCSAGLLLADEGLHAGAIRAAQRQGFARAQLESADPDTIGAAVEALKQFVGVHCLDPDDSGSTLESFVAGMETRAEGKPQVWLLDSAQVIRMASTKSAEARIRVKELAEKVKAEARKRSAVVLLLSQSNRASYRAKKDDDNADPLTSGGESGSLEHMADVFLWMAPDGEDRVKLMVPKNRIGTGPSLVPWHLRLDRATATFREIDETEPDPETEAAEAKRMAAMGKLQEKILATLKRQPDGLSGRQVREVVGGRPQAVTEALRLLETDFKIFSEPSEKRGGGMVWKLSR